MQFKSITREPTLYFKEDSQMRIHYIIQGKQLFIFFKYYIKQHKNITREATLYFKSVYSQMQ